MVEVAAVHGRANASLVTGYGYTGILVAFIARARTRSASFRSRSCSGGIGASGGLLQRVFELPDATVNVLQGILFIAPLSRVKRSTGRRVFAAASPAAAVRR